jgi:hypothetical protein
VGTIGVRCARPHTNLWFHVGVRIAYDHLHPDFRNDGREDKMNELLHRGEPWGGLTDVGTRIVKRVLDIQGGFLGLTRLVLGLSVVPNYFDLEVKNEKAWRRVLPEVVRIIREETGDPKAAVRLYQKPGGPPVEQWHEPLIRELYG